MENRTTGIKNRIIPRFVLAAPKSGSGKTLLTCGMIRLLQKRGLTVASFKCGPDYIDPMFHRKVLGVESGNLDSFFTDEKTMRYLLYEEAKQADVAVIEGVMGYYDGLGGTSEQGSTYEIASFMGSPVILIVDAKGASVSLAALVKGMKEYREDSNIRGIILNRVSPSYYERISQVIRKECGIPVLGFVPVLKEAAVASRHLGLLSPDEVEDFEKKVNSLAAVMEENLDLEQILDIAGAAQEFKTTDLMEDSKKNSFKNTYSVRIGIARDEAFSFYYRENMELLSLMGAEPVFFSPIHDEKLPEEIDGLILGGGYPENYIKELSANQSMKASIQHACEKKMPLIAECGGFLYLQKTLKNKEGLSGEMAGILLGEGFPTEGLKRFGYLEGKIVTPGLLGDAGECIRGHEFHHWDCSENGTDFAAKKPFTEKSYPCMIHTPYMAAGFPHFYYYSNPGILKNFLKACVRYQAKRLAKKHWESIAKPLDSLGLLEDMVIQVCGIRGNADLKELPKKALLILCGDHGVVAEGVTQTDQSVTRIVSENFAKGCSTVNYMAQTVGVDIYTVDIGMNTPCYPTKELVQNAVIDRKVQGGSGNIALEPAMTLEKCKKAVQTGIELVGQLKEAGYEIIATGEMGIGNTTPTSVLAAEFLKQPPQAVTGKGAGLSAEGLCRKRETVEKALKRIHEKQLTDPMEILAEAGGLELAGMTGVFLGGVRYGIPIVIDGCISAICALTASLMDRRVEEIALASHQSEEITGRLALERLGKEPLIHGHMCLGEGSGAVTVLSLLDMAFRVYENMGTFAAYSIDPYERFEKEQGDAK